MKHPSLRACVSSLFVLAVAAAAPLPASADRPLVSETADVIDQGQCILDSAARRLKEPGFAALRSIGGAFSCGVGSNTQVLAAWQRQSGGGLSAQGMNLGGKTNLVEVKDEQTGWGVAYVLGAVKAGSGGFKHDTVAIYGLATRELSKGLLGHANFGWSHSRLDKTNSAIWSLGVETTDTLSVAADVWGDGRSKPNLSAGVAYQFMPGWSVNFALAKALEAPKGRELSAGLRIVF